MILFEAGLRLSFRELEASLRGIVVRLVAIGVLVTWVGVAAASALLFDGLGGGVPLMIGAILVVSGPTVVLPLLGFVRPRARSARRSPGRERWSTRSAPSWGCSCSTRCRPAPWTTPESFC